MFYLKETSIEWAMKHLRTYYDSDFFPKILEFTAIMHDWKSIKAYISKINLLEYSAHSPIICLAPKKNNNFRVVHQLDPIDSIIYTALIYEIADKVEKFRIPKEKKNVYSYRILPDSNGSLFESEVGWTDFTKRTKELCEEYIDGYVIVADITAFYNQIYTSNIKNLIDEAANGELNGHAKVVEKFINDLNRQTARGIPVGPAPSIILSEIVMGDVDRKILEYTSDFVRYVDDMRIFFKDKKGAIEAMHGISKYLYSSHRLVFASSKTELVSVQDFLNNYKEDEENQEEIVKNSIKTELLDEKLQIIFEDIYKESPYSFFNSRLPHDAIKTYGITEEEEAEILENCYFTILKSLLDEENLNYSFIRYIIKKATKFRVSNLVETILDKFDFFMPVIREISIYLKTVLDTELIIKYEEQLKNIWFSPYIDIEYINRWISFLFQHDNFIEFNRNNLDLKSVKSVRDKAIFAYKLRNTSWFRDYRDGVEQLASWDKRAVLYASSVLPYSEMKEWVTSVASAGDIIDKAIAAYIVDKFKP
ncbi:RNA-directed DNA polymerase [Clostridium sp. YIM B02506]|uniref:RNA-directed DNA polymerase n=1 Tax=Clostridium sp. YIM B02506 TaxID=2910680 RepID=UPI001EEED9D3|nr:RNA-directed DNA polymerase [Clostridium sp. YIM B02506]